MEKKRSDHMYDYETEMHGQTVTVRVFSSPCEPTFNFDKMINKVMEADDFDMYELWDIVVNHRSSLTEWESLDKGLAGDITVVSTPAMNEQLPITDVEEEIIPVDIQLMRDT